MSNGNADAIEQAVEQGEFDQIEAPPGVIEAIELYEAVMPHYVSAAARLNPISRISSTSTSQLKLPKIIKANPSFAE